MKAMDTDVVDSEDLPLTQVCRVLDKILRGQDRPWEWCPTAGWYADPISGPVLPHPLRSYRRLAQRTAGPLRRSRAALSSVGGVVVRDPARTLMAAAAAVPAPGKRNPPRQRHADTLSGVSFPT